MRDEEKLVVSKINGVVNARYLIDFELRSGDELKELELKFQEWLDYLEKEVLIEGK